jgi:ketosteroid isomerase-like protein
MRTRRTGALLLILALGACASARRSAEPDAAAEGAINRVMDDFHDAAASADFDRYFGHFAKDAVFLGTDASERWTRDQFMAYARPYFKPGGGWAYHPRGRRISFTPDGRTAYFDELLDNTGLGETRGSGVLVREGGEWKVAQYNLSIPIPNPLADSVVRIVRGRPR